MTSKTPRALGVLHVSPNTDYVTNTAASDMARRVARANPSMLYASQNAPVGADSDPRRADVVQIASAHPMREWGQAVPSYGMSQTSIDKAVKQTLTRVDKAFAGGANRVLLDEVRGNTADVAAQVLRQLPAKARNKVLAYIVGGPKVAYQGNRTFSGPGLWKAMHDTGTEAVLESYGSPTMDAEKGAQSVKQKVDWLAKRGIAASPAVGLGDQYNDPGFSHTIFGQNAERVAGNNQAQLWSAAIRKAVGPNVPISEWVAGTAKSPIAKGRLAAVVKGSKPLQISNKPRS